MTNFWGFLASHLQQHHSKGNVQGMFKLFRRKYLQQYFQQANTNFVCRISHFCFIVYHFGSTICFVALRKCPVYWEISTICGELKKSARRHNTISRGSVMNWIFGSAANEFYRGITQWKLETAIDKRETEISWSPFCFDYVRANRAYRNKHFFVACWFSFWGI